MGEELEGIVEMWWRITFWGWMFILSIIAAVTICSVVLMYTYKQVFGSSEWLSGVHICVDIWQQTHNETLYYECLNPLDEITVRE
jgi:hypothetical protein